MEIVQTNSNEYQSEITSLYVEVFSTGKSMQYIDKYKLNLYISQLLTHGFALLAIDKNEVIGAVLVCPLGFDKLLPVAISSRFNIAKCLYVAEVMVAGKEQGKGIGKALMKSTFAAIDTSVYSDVFIRVWGENTPAISLYETIGFKPVATIEQIQKRHDGNGTFVMNKIYLHKKMN